MGASVSMARGAADAGLKYVLGVIGDSTFIHSGITCLVDAVQSNANMTLCILDNSTVAMTGCQETLLPSDKLTSLILGLGVAKEHLLEVQSKPTLVDENAALVKKEMEHQGLSVIIFRRECLESLKAKFKAKRATGV
jgi:indolepyruvate ferredoxin oxidoreductase alpha subunit